MNILQVENLTRIYGEGENTVRALDGVSLSVEKGELWRLWELLAQEIHAAAFDRRCGPAYGRPGSGGR